MEPLCGPKRGGPALPEAHRQLLRMLRKDDVGVRRELADDVSAADVVRSFLVVTESVGRGIISLESEFHDRSGHGRYATP